jgi:tetratricopeptide (TPR) repeat protein
MLGDADGALADYNEAIRLKPDFFLCYFNRGCVLGRFRGDHEGALQDLRKALELAPPDWSLRKEAERLVAMALGYVATPKAVSLQQEGRKLLTQQSYDRAVETFRKIIEEFPGTPEAAPAAYNIACAYALSGRKPLALDWLEKSVEMGFHDADHIAKDSDLDPLREDPRYGKLIERLKK